MNPDHEPISPPTSPTPHEEEEHDSGDVSDSNCEDTYTPADGSEGKEDYDSDALDDDDDEDERHNSSDVPSSPPTSVETGSKDNQRNVSGELDGSADGGYRVPAVETEDEDEDEQEHTTYFSNRYENGDDTFHRKNWENSSQWEDEETHAPPPMARVQSQTSSRKSPAPSSPMFPPRPRQTNSAKSGLSHQFSSRRSPASRASSGSYETREIHRDEKKPPLVLLHVTLLLLPGAEEVVLRHITPTTLERGVLVEHPRGDYNLLEELILDGLGLDEDFLEEPISPEEPLEKTWEQALNILPTPASKKAWQLRVYASNGLMTPGAWKRVWAEMERIDVEIWPRGYDRCKPRSNRSSISGGHSRNSSSVAPDLDYDIATRNSSGPPLASSAPVPASKQPTATPKSRKSRRGAQAAGFDWNKILTPKAVMVYAGINLGLFVYLTLARFVSLGSTWTAVTKWVAPSGTGTVRVHTMYDDGCVVEEFGGEEIADVVVEDVVAEDVVVEAGHEQQVLEGEVVEGEVVEGEVVEGEVVEGEVPVPDPEISEEQVEEVQEVEVREAEAEVEIPLVVDDADFDELEQAVEEQEEQQEEQDDDEEAEEEAEVEGEQEVIPEGGVQLDLEDRELSDIISDASKVVTDFAEVTEESQNSQVSEEGSEVIDEAEVEEVEAQDEVEVEEKKKSFFGSFGFS